MDTSKGKSSWKVDPASVAMGADGGAVSPEKALEGLSTRPSVCGWGLFLPEQQYSRTGQLLYILTGDGTYLYLALPEDQARIGARNYHDEHPNQPWPLVVKVTATISL